MTMTLKILLVALYVIGTTIVTATRVNQEPLTKYCDDVLRSGVTYTSKELVTLDYAIWDMDVSHHTGNIYIIHMDWLLHVIHKGERKTKLLRNEKVEGEAVAVNKNVPEVYIGGRSGLKIYNEYTDVITNIPGMNRFIYRIFIPKTSPGIYVRHSDSGIYRYNNIVDKGIKLNVDFERIMTHTFVVDAEENLYYNTKQNNHDYTKVLYKGHPGAVKFNDGAFHHLAADNADRVYGAHTNGVYRLNADGSKQNIITKLDFRPWHTRFDRDNNMVFGTSENKIIVFKFNYHCISWPTQAVTNISIALDSINEIQREVTGSLDEVKSKFNQTYNEQNKNIHSSLSSAIEPIKEILHKTSLKYDKILLKLNNDVNQLNGCLDRNNQQTDMGKIEQIESKIEKERKIMTNNFEKMMENIIKTLNNQNFNKWEIIDAMTEKYDSLLLKMDNHMKKLNDSLAANNQHMKLAQIEKVERKIRNNVIGRVNNLDLNVLLGNMTEI